MILIARCRVGKIAWHGRDGGQRLRAILPTAKIWFAPLPTLQTTVLNHDARVAQVLIAVDQVDLPHRDQPAAIRADEAMAVYLLDGLLPAAGTICPVDARPFGD